ncbi:hypothetical protein ACCO45_006340 [Purpureocillium lilacinum]|uniref:Uncharacterized protein n=1 Tax=Purpureocillium lilacinum TaxID=33203 RepID=A0ACC4DSB2_PURLI
MAHDSAPQPCGSVDFPGLETALAFEVAGPSHGSRTSGSEFTATHWRENGQLPTSIPTRDANGELTCHPLVERVERAELAERHGRALDSNATGERCTRDESQPKHGTAVAQAASRRKLHVPRRTRRLQSLQLPAATLMGNAASAMDITQPFGWRRSTD